MVKRRIPLEWAPQGDNKLGLSWMLSRGVERGGSRCILSVLLYMPNEINAHTLY